MKYLSAGKKNIVKILVLTVLLCCTFFSVFLSGAYADDTPNSTDFTRSTSPSYRYFENPSLIASDNKNIYLADVTENNISYINIFSDAALEEVAVFTHPGTLTAIAAVDENLYVVEDGQTVYHYFINPLNPNPLTILEYSRIESDALTVDPFASLSSRIDKIFVSSDKFFVSSGKHILAYGRGTRSLSGLYSFDYNVLDFIVQDGTIYAAVLENGYKYSIYSLEISNNFLSLALDDIDSFKGISISNESKGIYILATTSILIYQKGIYELYLDKSKPLNSTAEILLFTTAPSGIFMINRDRTVLKLTAETEEVFATVSNEKGFYRNPSNVSTRHSKTFVADRNNNRVVVNNGTDFMFISESLPRPVATTVSTDEKLYVAYGENKIAAFNNKNERITEITSETIKIKNDVDPDANTETDLYHSKVSIIDIGCDQRNNIYILTRDGGFYIKKSGSDFFTLAFEHSVKSFTIPINGNHAYLFSGSDLIRLTTSASGEHTTLNLNVTIPQDIIDFTVDSDKSIYFLTGGNMISRLPYSGTSYGSITPAITVDNSKNLTKIEVSNIHNSTLSYRDVICIDTEMHTLKIVSGKLFGVNNDGITDREKPDTILPMISGNNKIIRTITKAGGCDVYAQSSEVSVIRTLPQGFKVIVPEYSEDTAFTRIIADNVLLGSNASDNEILIGYVNTSFLSEPLNYTASPVSECRVWLYDVSVYSLPSRQASIIDGYKNIEKNSLFPLLDFTFEVENSKIIYGYRDNFPDSAQQVTSNRWYRIQVDGKNNEKLDGYVLAPGMSVLGGNPDLNIRPQANGEIIAKKHSAELGAYIYKYDEATKTYVVDPHHEPLPIGTKVEVVGSFDSSEPFHKILFYTSYGTVEGYADTDNLKYYGVNLVQVVAIIVIILTAILLIILFARYIKLKNNAKLNSKN